LKASSELVVDSVWRVVGSVLGQWASTIETALTSHLHSPWNFITMTVGWAKKGM